MTNDDKALVEVLRELLAAFKGEAGRRYSCDLFEECADRIEALSAENERLREALERQCDNMAFSLNHTTVPDDWYDKFVAELKCDRAALGEQQ